mmetsp:Transcript_25472/g.70344  ORF Transcript_25472/g.70344 Transcript_25472/m.70344 type:complete len:319 (-) Transcript_25472:162-1118(-)
MPPNVRGYQCAQSDKQICKDRKWSTYLDPKEPCNKRSHQQSWHPGWQWHALQGHLLTQFLIEVLDDALSAIGAYASDPETLLETLRRQEQQFFSNFFPKNYSTKWPFPMLPTGESIDAIYKRPNYCSIARLPAQIRYAGILTGYSGNYIDSSYDRGTNQTDQSVFSAHEEVQLMWTESNYQTHCKKDLLEIDHTDWFLGATKNSSPKMILPTDSEIAAYGNHVESLVGYIFICRAPGPDLDKKHQLGIEGEGDSLENGDYNITVNKKLVTGYTYIFGCALLKHQGGYIFPKRENGRFEFKFFTDRQDSYVRFTSVMVW